jgi:glycosyltransferase involved in cell wall biosynthesis
VAVLVDGGNQPNARSEQPSQRQQQAWREAMAVARGWVLDVEDLGTEPEDGPEDPRQLAKAPSSSGTDDLHGDRLRLPFTARQDRDDVDSFGGEGLAKSRRVVGDPAREACNSAGDECHPHRGGLRCLGNSLHRHVDDDTGQVTRAAIVQDWFFTPGGSEQVALELASLVPEARVYTSFADRQATEQLGHRLQTWPPQRIWPGSPSYRRFLPLYPIYFERLDLRNYELVISSSVAFTHAVRTARAATHISYVYTPLRYAWDLDTYLQGSSFSPVAQIGAKVVRPWLRRWDRRTADRPDVVIAISRTVQERIRALWGRESDVIYPPVAVDDIAVSGEDDGYLLVAARLLAYRRIDLAVRAAKALNRDLVVIGDGPERQRLEAAAGSRTRFFGRVDRPRLLDVMARCHAYLVPGIEDFGIAPIEAMAAGKPVVGFNAGGVSETVVDGQTGVLFDAQTPDALAAAVERLDGIDLARDVVRAQAERFDQATFRSRFRELFVKLGVDPALYSVG